MAHNKKGRIPNCEIFFNINKCSKRVPLSLDRLHAKIREAIIRSLFTGAMESNVLFIVQTLF